MDAAFSGAASAVTGLVFAPLDVADRVAERFGGSRVVTGVTGGVRSTVGGVVGGGTAVVGGFAGRGSGSCAGRVGRRGITRVGEAGRAFAGGVVGGVGSVVGGVAHAGQDVVGGVRAGVRSTSTTLFDQCLFGYTQPCAIRGDKMARAHTPVQSSSRGKRSTLFDSVVGRSSSGTSTSGSGSSASTGGRTSPTGPSAWRRFGRAFRRTIFGVGSSPPMSHWNGLPKKRCRRVVATRALDQLQVRTGSS